MILTKDKILKMVKKGKVRIEPFSEDAVGPASIDLTLGKEFRVFDNKKAPVFVEEKTDYKKLTKVVNGPITLNPGDFVHGITEEKVTLPGDICGLLTGRSRFARLGILVHATASFIQPGVSNHQILEIKNVSPRALVLTPGLKICQLSLMKCKGRAVYSGKWVDQEKV